MGGSGGASGLASIMDKLPSFRKVIGWFKGNDMNIDNHLFRMHYLGTTFMILIGFIVICEKNYLDIPQKSILCHTDKTFSEYAKTYCWIHGTSYVREALRGKATGCFVDQSKVTTEEDAPVTAYYLWLPYLLAVCFALARMPRSTWKRFFENGLIRHILKGKSESPTSPQRGGGGGMAGGGQNNQKKNREIAENFLDFRHRYAKYHVWFGLCEALNIVSIVLSMGICHWLLNYQFAFYGMRVIEYLGTPKQLNSLGQYITHDPMCELFPTEVACTLRYGASTGALDRSNFLCILGNNLFNQKYFLVLWCWWAFLLALSILMLVYRFARISIPEFSRTMLMRKVHGKQLRGVHLRSADYFVLDLMAQNMEDRQMYQVLEVIENRIIAQRQKVPSGSDDDSASVIIEETKFHNGGPGGPGNGIGYSNLPQKGSPKKNQQMSPGKKQPLPPPPQQQKNNVYPLMKESHMPMHLMRLDEVDMGGAASAPRYVQQSPEKKSMKSLSIDQETQVVRGELPSSDSSGGIPTPEEGPISEGTTVSMEDSDDEDYDEDEQNNFEEMLNRLQAGGVHFK